MQKEIEDAYKEVIREKERQRAQQASARVSKARDEQDLREVLVKEERKQRLAEVAGTAKENISKNEVTSVASQKRQEHLTQQFMREFGKIETEKEESELIEYDISQDELQMIEKLSPENGRGDSKGWGSLVSGEDQQRESRAQGGILGNSFLLNEKDISLNYSGLDSQGMVNDALRSETVDNDPVDFKKQYFTRDFSRNTSKISNDANRKTGKTKKGANRKDEAERTPLKRTLKKSKINKPPRIQKQRAKREREETKSPDISVENSEQ